jgi:hypothetical protein
MHRQCLILPFLHEILGFLQGSDVASTPAEIIPPLRRMIQSLLPGSEILVVSTPQLNYSITEISQGIKTKLFHDLSRYTNQLPEYFFIITIPQAESDQVLMHCMLSHEAGHGLYALHEIAKDLLPTIAVNN